MRSLVGHLWGCTESPGHSWRQKQQPAFCVAAAHSCGWRIICVSSAAQFPGVRLGFWESDPMSTFYCSLVPALRGQTLLPPGGASFFSQQVSKNDESLKNKTELLVAITEIRRCRTVTRAGGWSGVCRRLGGRKGLGPIHIKEWALTILFLSPKPQSLSQGVWEESTVITRITSHRV